MSTVQNPAIAGQETDPSSNPLTEILTAIRGLSARLGALEQRFEWLDRDCLKAIKAASLPVPEHLIEERPEEEPDTDPDPEPPHVPTLALTSDGTVLLSLHYLTGADISGRERWTGVVLTEAEACDVLDAMSDAADDTAAHVGGRIIKRSKKSERDDE
ncbi:MAG: hypothetical protein L6Q76_13455 [Polyangiaceae bacterium]|nr:hypothetical protein [Polyangiaceae bacterium]